MRLSLLRQLRFDKRVAIVTGAGGGLGREYALGLAARGANDVVNDLLKSDKGYAAESVVNEIQKAGGVAVPNFDSVENAEAIVQTALKQFGRVDVLINNAGQLRDRAFANMTEEEFTEVQRVHNLAVFRLTKLVWPKMREQKYGRLLFVASSAGLFGNFGQTNYSSAKMSVYGMARTLALEGSRYGIQANVIAPLAVSQMTRSLVRDEDAARLSPAAVAPFVVWLSHESCAENGATFYLGGGWCSPVRTLIGTGVDFRDTAGNLTAECIRDNWSRMKSIPTTDEMESATHAFAYVVNQLDHSAKLTKKLTGFDDLPGSQLNETFKYTSNHASLYALSIGASVSNADNLKYIFERHPSFSPFPTCLTAEMVQSTMKYVPNWWNSFGANHLRILHGEQYYEVVDYEALTKNIGSNFKLRTVVEDVVDKGKGVLVVIRTDLLDDSDKLVVTSQCGFFQMGDRCKNKKFVAKQIPLADASHFQGKPDAVVEQRTSEDQAALYRLTGDLNPVHIDPDSARSVNLKVPILHGLCTFGFVTRHVLQQFGNNDPRAFKSIKVRFTSPVLPGQTIRTEMWATPEQNGVQRIYVQARVAETNEVCIGNSYVDLLKNPAKP